MPTLAEPVFGIAAHPPMSAPDRLRATRDIRAVSSSPQRQVTSGAVLRLRRRRDGRPGRMTVTASRRLGGAVRRNRAKRRLRAALRRCGLPSGVDVLAVATAASVDQPFDRLCEELAEALEAAPPPRETT